MIYHYETSPEVCSRAFEIEIDDSGRIMNFRADGGCPGNLQGIESLIKGMLPEEVVSRLEGIRCGGKNTSCPDQLARALREIIENTGRM